MTITTTRPTATASTLRSNNISFTQVGNRFEVEENEDLKNCMFKHQFLSKQSRKDLFSL